MKTMIDATIGAGTVHPSRRPAIICGFQLGLCCSICNFLCSVLQIITTFVSLSISYIFVQHKANIKGKGRSICTNPQQSRIIHYMSIHHTIVETQTIQLFFFIMHEIKIRFNTKKKRKNNNVFFIDSYGCRKVNGHVFVFQGY